jgi:hypothetical protein
MLLIILFYHIRFLDFSDRTSLSSACNHGGVLMQERSLRDLLESCCDARGARWESGWYEFIRRYKRFIYQMVARTCASWGAARLHKQLPETIDDVVSDVLALLCEDRGRVLKGFKARGDERLFLSWLATVCRRRSSRHILRYYSSKLVDSDAGEIPGLVSSLEIERQGELYEHLVSLFRRTAARNKIHLERDILIFQMHAWADFSMDMILRVPCFDRIGHRVVDNTVSRMRSVLRRDSGISVER